MCFEFSLCLFPFTASPSLSPPFSSALSLPPSLAHTHTNRLYALSLLIGPFSPHESIPFRCIWGYGCHWQPSCQSVAASISVGGFQKSLQHRQSGYWWSPFYRITPTNGQRCVTKALRGVASLILWPNKLKSQGFDALALCGREETPHLPAQSYVCLV